MKPASDFKSALVTGLVIVLPAWLAILLLLKLLVQLDIIVKPIAGHLPDEVNHPQVIALLLFFLLCLIVGLVVQTAIGRAIGRILGSSVFNRVPGYQSLRSIARQIQGMESSEGFKPALIVVEDGCLAPAFLIEFHADGRATVFLPSVPTPMAGSLYIMPADRVHLIDVPVTTMMRCISKWGSGSKELVAALGATPP